MLTLIFSHCVRIKREALTQTSVVEYNMAVHHYGVGQRPTYKFTLQLQPITRPELAWLTGQHAFHQGAKPFLWDGGQYGAVENYNLVGEGNGADTSFYLPNRRIGASSAAIQTLRPSTGVTSDWVASYSLSPGDGKLIFAAAVTSGDEVRAKYGCTYQVNFAADGVRVRELAAGVYGAEVVLTENVLL